MFLDNLATLDSPTSSSPLSTQQIFEQKSAILPNSIIGRHLKFLRDGVLGLMVDMWKVEWPWY
jgi:hypothetical protein